MWRMNATSASTRPPRVATRRSWRRRVRLDAASRIGKRVPMFPIRDHNPTLRTPFVVYALIAANVFVFALQVPYMADERELAGFWSDRARYPALVTVYGDYTGIFTSTVLHAGFLPPPVNKL